MKSERGDWHRRTRRGTAPPSVAGAGVTTCGFCGKTFKTVEGMRQHEQDVHAKLTQQRLREIAALPEPDTSDIPEADEAWFNRARLILPKEEQ